MRHAYLVRPTSPKQLQTLASGILTQGQACGCGQKGVVGTWGSGKTMNEYSWASGPTYKMGQSSERVWGDNSPLLPTLCHNRWKTLQRAYSSCWATQKPTMWGLEQLCMTYGTPSTHRHHYGHRRGPRNPLYWSWSSGIGWLKTTFTGIIITLLLGSGWAAYWLLNDETGTRLSTWAMSQEQESRSKSLHRVNPEATCQHKQRSPIDHWRTVANCWSGQYLTFVLAIGLPARGTCYQVALGLAGKSGCFMFVAPEEED